MSSNEINKYFQNTLLILEQISIFKINNPIQYSILFCTLVFGNYIVHAAKPRECLTQDLMDIFLISNFQINN